MPIDHQRTAAQIEADLTALENMCKPSETVSKARAFSSIKDHFLGLADWHQEQANRQQKSLNLQRAHETLKPVTS